MCESPLCTRGYYLLPGVPTGPLTRLLCVSHRLSFSPQFGTLILILFPSLFPRSLAALGGSSGDRAGERGAASAAIGGNGSSSPGAPRLHGYDTHSSGPGVPSSRSLSPCSPNLSLVISIQREPTGSGRCPIGVFHLHLFLSLPFRGLIGWRPRRPRRRTGSDGPSSGRWRRPHPRCLPRT